MTLHCLSSFEPNKPLLQIYIYYIYLYIYVCTDANECLLFICCVVHCSLWNSLLILCVFCSCICIHLVIVVVSSICGVTKYCASSLYPQNHILYASHPTHENISLSCMRHFKPGHPPHGRVPFHSRQSTLFSQDIPSSYQKPWSLKLM